MEVHHRMTESAKIERSDHYSREESSYSPGLKLRSRQDGAKMLAPSRDNLYSGLITDSFSRRAKMLTKNLSKKRVKSNKDKTYDTTYSRIKDMLKKP